MASVYHKINLSFFLNTLAKPIKTVRLASTIVGAKINSENVNRGDAVKRMFLRTLPVMLIFSMIVVSCSMPNITPAPSATGVGSQTDDVWNRVMANNKMVVGTSWDYPPFASIDSSLHPVGFDIALIKEIGRRLNIPVEIQNYTFDGLPDALQLNQIDLAVAAISITPDRASRASFSPIYYVNQTAVLAKNGSAVTNITDFKQLAGYRVGVQRGTTYESMVRSSLVDTKLMSADQVFSYMQSTKPSEI